MLGITLRDQRHNTWIRQQTGVTDIIDHIRQSKHQWAGHVARLQDNRWTIRATSWVPRRWLRQRGRPKTRWRDDLSRHLGTTWTRLAQDRHQWKLSRDIYTHHICQTSQIGQDSPDFNVVFQNHNVAVKSLHFPHYPTC